MLNANATPDGRSNPLRFLSQDSSPVLPEVIPTSTESRFVCPFSQADIARLVIMTGSVTKTPQLPSTVVKSPIIPIKGTSDESAKSAHIKAIPVDAINALEIQKPADIIDVLFSFTNLFFKSLNDCSFVE